MMKQTKHIEYYATLFVVLGSGFFIATNVSYNKQLQMMAVVITAILYVALGLLHHTFHHDVSHKIVVEYVLIAALGITIFALLIQGAL